MDLTTDIMPVSILLDNYAWLIKIAEHTAAAVDPGEAGPVLEELEARGLELGAVLLTHHHHDHVAGVSALVQSAAGEVPVYGPRNETIRGVTHQVGEGACLELGELALEVIEVPGHTASHIAYVGDGALLSGDTLFTGGCGRVVEGTHAQMYRSLCRLAALPESTEVYCAHEYTQANLRFALAVEPSNQALLDRIDNVERLLGQGLPTAASSIAEELATNPFLRCEEATVVEAASSHADRSASAGAETFEILRRWKNRFR